MAGVCVKVEVWQPGNHDTNLNGNGYFWSCLFLHFSLRRDAKQPTHLGSKPRQQDSLRRGLLMLIEKHQVCKRSVTGSGSERETLCRAKPKDKGRN